MPKPHPLNIPCSHLLSFPGADHQFRYSEALAGRASHHKSWSFGNLTTGKAQGSWCWGPQTDTRGNGTTQFCVQHRGVLSNPPSRRHLYHVCLHGHRVYLGT